MTELARKLELSYVRLDLGCGANKEPILEDWRGQEWIRQDGFPHEGVDVVCDWENIALPDKSIDEIYTRDTIEHIPVYKQDIILKEWNRILKIGGILGGSTPNLETAISQYVKGEINFEWLLQNLYGDRANPYQQHYILFTEKTLKETLMKYGFENVDCSMSPGGSVAKDWWWLCFKCKKIADV